MPSSLHDEAKRHQNQPSHSSRRKRKAYGVLPYRKTTSTSTFCGECHRMMSEMLSSRGGLLLIWFTWPIAVVTMIVAHLKRVWQLGTLYPNAAHLIGDGTSHAASTSNAFAITPDMDPRLALSALELGRKVRDKTDPLTSRLLVELCIAQMKRVDPYLRAVVATRFDQARSEASVVDTAVAACHDDSVVLPPFCGVPLVIKEVFEFEGLPYTAGLVGRKGTVGRVTGPVLTQVQQQTGAIVLASTNISEACMWHESTNHVYGTTNNPYDFSRTAGGSSGGCGAAVASCMVPVSIASDVGGSIRIPALYNGLFGHKPTGGLVSNANTYPDVGTGDIQRFCQLGPLTRRSEDLWPLLVAMKTPPPASTPVEVEVEVPAGGVKAADKSGREKVADCSSDSDGSSEEEVGGGDVCFPEGQLLQLSSPELLQVDFSKLVVYYTKRNLGSSLFISALHPDVSVGMDAALAFLEKQGALLVDFDEEEALQEMFAGLNAFRVWSALMSTHRHQPFSVTIREGLGVEKAAESAGSEGGAEPLSLQISFLAAVWELLKSLVDMSLNTFPAMLLAVAEFVSDLPVMEAENQRQCAEGLRLKDELEFLLSPEYRVDDLPPPCHDGSPEHGLAQLAAGSIDSETDKSAGDCEEKPSFIKSKVLAREHVLLLPSLPTPAPFHAESIVRVFDTSNTAFFNVMQLPVTAVPLGLCQPRSSHSGSGRGSSSSSSSGAGRLHRATPQRRGQLLSGACNLPVGMQIVGGPHRDHVTIGIAMALEKAALAGWCPPVAR